MNEPWDLRYQQNDTPWDKGAPAPPLLELLQKKADYWGNGTVLVPGCGLAHDAAAIAKTGKNVLAVDLSKTAIQRAKEIQTEKTLNYQVDDFLEAQHYDQVSSIFEHTCFCAINPNLRTQYRDACLRLLPSGGHLVGIFFMNPRDEDDPDLGPPFQSKKEELITLFSNGFTLKEAYLPQQQFKARKGRELVMIWEKM